MRLLTTIVLAAFVSGGAAGSILPPNNLHLEDNLFSLNANIDEAKFNEIIDGVIGYYSPIVAAHGANLTVDKKWNDSTVNAYAQQTGSNWNVAMFGGLARRQEVTPDGFALVVCHELGHHLAGFPFYAGGNWAASEGQSDYFATQSCARNVWANDTATNAESRNTVDAPAKAECDNAWSTEAEQNLCYRIAMGGKSLGTLLASLGGQGNPQFETPDVSVVTTTTTSHPAGQCRLDTYFQGALCKATFDKEVIPGRNNQNGQESLEAETEAAVTSCTRSSLYAVGNRPKCWYAPKLEIALNVVSTEWNETSGDGDGYLEPGETFDIINTLRNNTQNAIDAIDSILTTADSGVQISIAETSFRDLSPARSVAQLTPFEFTLGEDVACGSTISFNMSLEFAGRNGAINLTKTVGREVLSDLFGNQSEMDIPDNNPNGVMSSVTVDGLTGGTKASVSVSIQHTYVGDLVVAVIAPSGREYRVHNKTGGSRDDINETFEIDVSGEQLNGEWTLKVVDTASRDTGKILNWGFQTQYAQCD